MDTKGEKERLDLFDLAGKSSDLIGDLAATCSDEGKTHLRGAIPYLFAACIGDIAESMAAESTYVKLSDGAETPMREYVVEHLMGAIAPIMKKRGGMEYVYEIKRKATAIIASRSR